MPGGQPSTTQPTAGPWDSPQVETRKRVPKVLPAIQEVYPTGRGRDTDWLRWVAEVLTTLSDDAPLPGDRAAPPARPPARTPAHPHQRPAFLPRYPQGSCLLLNRHPSLGRLPTSASDGRFANTPFAIYPVV